MCADGDVAVNVAAYVAMLRDLDVDGDYPGFVVDEVVGRALAAAVAGGTPLRMLGEATFHYADVTTEAGGGEGGGGAVGLSGGAVGSCRSMFGDVERLPVALAESVGDGPTGGAQVAVFARGGGRTGWVDAGVSVGGRCSLDVACEHFAGRAASLGGRRVDG